jgi:L-asparagine transporter-like permease
MNNKVKGMSAGHLTMMALGSVIGGSFFLGTGVAMNAAGPSIVVSFILGGLFKCQFVMNKKFNRTPLSA